MTVKRPSTAYVAGRTPGSGPVLAVLTDALRALPVTAVRQLVDRFAAAAVVTALPLRDPTGTFNPTGQQRPDEAALPVSR